MLPITGSILGFLALMLYFNVIRKTTQKKEDLEYLGVEVFGSKERFDNWMDAPNEKFGGKKPKEVNKNEVIDVLLAMENIYH